MSDNVSPNFDSTTTISRDITAAGEPDVVEVLELVKREGCRFPPARLVDYTVTRNAGAATCTVVMTFDACG